MKTIFDPEKETSRIVNWIRNWFEWNANEGAYAVIGISGGKDSTIAAKLCTLALGKDRVVGVLMPDGQQPDIADSMKVVKELGIKSTIIDIKGATDGLLGVIRLGIFGPVGMFEDNALRYRVTEQVKQNIPPRIRMTVLYAVAQGLPNGGRVVNTCNASEDYVGYSTKYGDAAGDFAPLGAYTVTEVRAIGDYLGLPKELVHKAPSDGLCGKTDEDNLGFTYDVLDRYISTGVCEDSEVKQMIDDRRKANLHKISPMPMVERR